MAGSYSQTRGRLGVAAVSVVGLAVVLITSASRGAGPGPERHELLGAALVAAAALPWVRGAVVARPLTDDDAAPWSELGWFVAGLVLAVAGVALYAS